MNLDLVRVALLARQNLFPLLIGGLGIVLILFGIVSIVVSNPREGVIFEEKATSEFAEIFVDVAGAVVAPGVYKLSGGARIQDALISAGGLSGEADREWVAKNLNLSAKLTDGGKIYIPVKSETLRLRSGQELKVQSGEVSSVQTSNLININTAGPSQLDKLPGIGPVTAGKIIDGRPYADINDLVSKKIVGKKVFEQIKEKISVY